MKISELVKDKKVFFDFYRQGVLYYKTEDGFRFEVPILDTGDACFNKEDKAILFMRWIRKQLENNEAGRNDNTGIC